MLLTTKLNSGLVVLARDTKYGISAYQYANKTMARYALGRREPELKALPRFKRAYVAGRYPFYIAIEFE